MKLPVAVDLKREQAKKAETNAQNHCGKGGDVAE
jgi:hypothetical protein